VKLFTYFRSSASFRVRIALNLKGLPYEPQFVHMPKGEHHSAQYSQINRQELLPTLEDGAVVLNQSLAIIEYLEETHPAPPLLPRAPAQRAQVRALTLAIACDIHPLNNLRVLNYLRSPLGHDEPQVNAWYAHWIARGFGALEQEVQALSADGRHMFGSSVTLADVCIVPQMYNARRLNCDVEPYPRLRAICAHLQTLPAFAAAAPEAQP